MKEPITIRGTKDESLRLRWVQKAVSKGEGRPTLTGMYVKGENVYGTDGYRVHSTKAAIGMLVVDDTILKGKIQGGDFVSDLEILEGQYPDLSTFAKDEPPVFEIFVNSKYLLDILSGMNGSVRLAFWGNNLPMEVYGKTKDDIPCHGLLMPMHVGTEIVNDWSPYERSPIEIPDDESE